MTARTRRLAVLGAPRGLLDRRQWLALGAAACAACSSRKLPATLDAPEIDDASDVLEERAPDVTSDAVFSDQAADSALKDASREDTGVDAAIDASAPDAGEVATDALDAATDTPTTMDATDATDAMDATDATDATDAPPEEEAPDVMSAADVSAPDTGPADAGAPDVVCPPGALGIGPLRDFARGTWTLLMLDALIVGHDVGGLFAFDAMCTHSGCVVSAPNASGESECGCHGSRFDGAGAVLRGPATIALAHYELVRCGDGLFVTDRSVDANTRLAL